MNLKLKECRLSLQVSDLYLAQASRSCTVLLTPNLGKDQLTN